MVTTTTSSTSTSTSTSTTSTTSTSTIIPLVNTSSISTTFWNVLWRMIRYNAVDPKARGVKWVWSAYPDEEIKYTGSTETIKGQYPIIVIDPVLPSHEPITVDQNMRNYTIPFTITVYSDRSDNLDTIHDNIDDIVYNRLATMTKAGITNVILTSSDYNYFMRGGVKVHYKTLNYEAEVTRYS